MRERKTNNVVETDLEIMNEKETINKKDRERKTTLVLRQVSASPVSNVLPGVGHGEVEPLGVSRGVHVRPQV